MTFARWSVRAGSTSELLRSVASWDGATALMHAVSRVADGQFFSKEMKNLNSWICLCNWPCLMPFTSLSLSLSYPILYPSSDLASRVLPGKDHLWGRADLGWAGICPTSEN